MKKLSPKTFSFLWNKRAFTLLVFIAGALALLSTCLLLVLKSVTYIAFLYLVYVIVKFK